MSQYQKGRTAREQAAATEQCVSLWHHCKSRTYLHLVELNFVEKEFKSTFQLRLWCPLMAWTNH